MSQAGQEKTPLLAAMRAYTADGAVAFHTPGHKQGKGMAATFKELVTEDGLRMEVSLMEELDDLHDPQGCIKEAQMLAAALYGADATYFAVNGTTGAIHAMLLAALDPGDEVLLPRNAHRSVIGGIMLVGAKPIYLQPELDPMLGIAMGIAPAAVEAAIQAHPKAKAVVLVHPTYYGVVSDLARIARSVHARGMLLLVDEAHGPHLKFSAALPMSALEAGADLVAQSTHKLVGSLTQTSMLHAKFGRVDLQRLRAVHSLLQSTSPNYLLLASLDVARWQMATEGEVLLERAVRLSRWAREEINRIKGLICFGSERMGTVGAFALDPTKLTVTVKGLGISGAAAERVLRRDYKIQAELADCYNVLFIISYADTKREVQYLIDALKSLSERFSTGTSREFRIACDLPPLPQVRLLPRQALFAMKRSMAFADAAGRICGEMITFYPPGIPVLCPGELIGADVIAYCQRMLEIGRKVVGPDDAQLKTIKVVK